MNAITALALSIAMSPGCPSDVNGDTWVDWLDVCHLLQQDPPSPLLTFNLLNILNDWGSCHQEVGFGETAIVELIGNDLCYEIWFTNPLPTDPAGGSTSLTNAVNVTVDLNGHAVTRCQVQAGGAVVEVCGGCQGSDPPGDLLRYQWYRCFSSPVDFVERTLMCTFEIDGCTPAPFIIPFNGCGPGANTLYAEPPSCNVDYPVLIERINCGAGLPKSCD